MFTDVQEVGVQASELLYEFRLHETRTAPDTKVCVSATYIICFFNKILNK